jgi:hypothetical protein
MVKLLLFNKKKLSQDWVYVYNMLLTVINIKLRAFAFVQEKFIFGF